MIVHLCENMRGTCKKILQLLEWNHRGFKLRQDLARLASFLNG
jgi:hypothetical protein